MEFITIKHIKDDRIRHKYQVRVDRASILGNPFVLYDEKYRDEVCDKYEEWFKKQLDREEFVEELNRLMDILKKYKRLELFCWCSPKRCHSETIKKYLEGKL